MEELSSRFDPVLLAHAARCGGMDASRDFASPVRERYRSIHEITDLSVLERFHPNPAKLRMSRQLLITNTTSNSTMPVVYPTTTSGDDHHSGNTNAVTLGELQESVLGSDDATTTALLPQRSAALVASRGGGRGNNDDSEVNMALLKYNLHQVEKGKKLRKLRELAEEVARDEQREIRRKARLGEIAEQRRQHDLQRQVETMCLVARQAETLKRSMEKAHAKEQALDAAKQKILIERTLKEAEDAHRQQAILQQQVAHEKQQKQLQEDKRQLNQKMSALNEARVRTLLHHASQRRSDHLNEVTDTVRTQRQERIDTCAQNTMQLEAARDERYQQKQRRASELSSGWEKRRSTTIDSNAVEALQRRQRRARAYSSANASLRSTTMGRVQHLIENEVRSTEYLAQIREKRRSQLAEQARSAEARRVRAVQYALECDEIYRNSTEELIEWTEARAAQQLEARANERQLHNEVKRIRVDARSEEIQRLREGLAYQKSAFKAHLLREKRRTSPTSSRGVANTISGNGSLMGPSAASSRLPSAEPNTRRAATDPRRRGSAGSDRLLSPTAGWPPSGDGSVCSTLRRRLSEIKAHASSQPCRHQSNVDAIDQFIVDIAREANAVQCTEPTARQLILLGAQHDAHHHSTRGGTVSASVSSVSEL